jgi:hypothetical protein
LTFEAIQQHVQSRDWQSDRKVHRSLYVLEQPFLDQVKYLASATEGGIQFPAVKVLEAFQKVDVY